MTTQGYWPDIALRWDRVGAPLRPGEADLVAYREALALAPAQGPRVLMLGATPEIYGLPWPPRADVVALDHTVGMLAAVWPGPRGRAVCGDWTRMPFPPASRDLALCDGGFHLQSSPDGQRALVASLARVLAPGGIVAIRLFVPPPAPEDPGSVVHDLLAHRIADVNVLKLRLAMALQTDPDEGVELASVWAAVFGSGLDSAEIAARAGWDPAELSALDAYRDCRTRYHFVTPGRVNELFSTDPGGFEMVSVTTPDYVLGDRCPTVVLRRGDGVKPEARS